MTVLDRRETTTIPTDRPTIERRLAQLRARMRGYLLLHGLALIVVWSVLAFWLGLSADYTPVRFGSSEMPRVARGVLLATVVAGVAWLAWRWILRGACAGLADRHLAVMLERRHRQFSDALVTAVELNDGRPLAGDMTRPLLDRTRATAEQRLADVPLGGVFNYRPLRRSLSAALLAIVSLGLLAAWAPQTWALGVRRLCLLTDDPWPRRTHLELIGFQDGKIKVARGGEVIIRARADASRPWPPPDLCQLDYRTADGERGQAAMSKDGLPTGGFQNYRFDGHPFKSILADVRFDLLADDCRVRDQVVQVVESPVLVDVRVICRPPEYTGLQPRTEIPRAGLRLPLGTSIEIHAKANKPLARVVVAGERHLPAVDVAIHPDRTDEFVWPVGRLTAPVSWEFTLFDADGLRGNDPYRLVLGQVEDKPPTLEMALRGISSVVTPQATIPIYGKAEDDYGIGRVWLAVQCNEAPPYDFTCTVSDAGHLEHTLDLREWSAEGRAAPQPDDDLVLQVFAEDRSDLEEGPHRGESEVITLQVVRPEKFLAILDARELDLRRRFEQTLSELEESRDALHRLRSEADASSSGIGFQPVMNLTSSGGIGFQPVMNLTSSGGIGFQPVMNLTLAAAAPSPSTTETDRRADALRRLRVDRALQSSHRATQELSGVAAGFLDIRDELINNRVDTPQLIARIQHQIAEPIQQRALPLFSELDARLAALADQLERGPFHPQLASRAVEQLDVVVAQLRQILGSMLELEDFQQLIDLVRQMLQDQEEVMDGTRKLRESELQELFEK